MNKITKISAILLTSMSMEIMFSNSIISLDSNIDSISASSRKTENANQKRKVVNKEIADGLKQDQGWANGTLDENGNPTDNGTPNSSYNWSLTVSKITYTKDGQLKAVVNGNFNSLSNTSKKFVGNSIQKSSIVILGSHYKKYEDMTDMIYTAFYDTNNNAIGHSKITNNSEFKFY